jgi:hypothetical protein
MSRFEQGDVIADTRKEEKERAFFLRPNCASLEGLDLPTAARMGGPILHRGATCGVHSAIG